MYKEQAKQSKATHCSSYPESVVKNKECHPKVFYDDKSSGKGGGPTKGGGQTTGGGPTPVCP